MKERYRNLIIWQVVVKPTKFFLRLEKLLKICLVSYQFKEFGFSVLSEVDFFLDGSKVDIHFEGDSETRSSGISWV